MAEEDERKVKANRKQAAAKRGAGEPGCSSWQQEMLSDSPRIHLGS